MRTVLLALCGLTLGAGWNFYDQSIAPLEQKQEDELREVAQLKGRIDAALRMVAETWVLEQSAGVVRTELHSLPGDHSSISASAWFPERTEKHFGRWGAAGALSRLNTALDEPELPDFEWTYWAVELPVKNSAKDVREVCLAITEIEPLNPSVRVLDVAVRPQAKDPTRHLVVMNVVILSRKAEAARDAVTAPPRSGS